MNGIRVWVDDERPMPDGYDLHIKTLSGLYQFLWCCVTSEAPISVSYISFDHDMPPCTYDANILGNVYEVLKFFVNNLSYGPSMLHARLPNVGVHSANPAGRDNIINLFINLQKVYK